MMNSLIKVDRVGSAIEATELQQLGVSHMGIFLGTDSRFSDSRGLIKEQAIEIRKVLTKSKLIIEVDFDHILLKPLIHLVQEVRADYIQLNSNIPVSPNVYQAIKAIGCGLFYSGIEASYEDDPSWLFADFENTVDFEKVLFQVSLLPDIENSWVFFKEECPKYPDELQISDVDMLAAKISDFCNFRA